MGLSFEASTADLLPMNEPMDLRIPGQLEGLPDMRPKSLIVDKPLGMVDGSSWLLQEVSN